MQKTTRQSGAMAEDFVARYLIEKGYAICCRNYSVRRGEIDIIARRNDVGVFVEVKMRRSDYFNLSQVVTPTKIKRIICAARDYIARHAARNCAWRFDVALVQELGEGFSVEYIENAFLIEDAGCY
jgi:putative endonuclease